MATISLTLVPWLIASNVGAAFSEGGMHDLRESFCGGFAFAVLASRVLRVTVGVGIVVEDVRKRQFDPVTDDRLDSKPLLCCKAMCHTGFK